MPHIDYYFSTISPFTYLAGTRLEDIVQKHGASVTYKPLDVISLFGRTGGTPLPQRHESRLSYRLKELQRQAKKAGLAIHEKPAHFPTNAAPASYAIIAAQSEGGGDVGALVHSVLRACWAEEKDIAADDVVRDCLSAAGLDPALADRGLLLGAETYAANLEEAVNAGVFGAPFYIVDGAEPFWGQDRLDDLDLFLSGKL
ncbi:2-hydroxychromene-2-carboxylate isomerase [Actibacterium lipolyticum]|uniref:2-hydroxychromene-2-carboxylate isomerase n=1 Tax=Actibacterium lipolyticum TaxID=1524263 RepID=A0A238JMJ6_9RHOB|nr:2-hydroxychromene-2-carboxylate isomerase [Actibacterium lipolyticum]SMX31653.1 2-hydroxychromene-2-carboxylate isomerase [Actibacterium lipolyticum]